MCPIYRRTKNSIRDRIRKNEGTKDGLNIRLWIARPNTRYRFWNVLRVRRTRVDWWLIKPATVHKVPWTRNSNRHVVWPLSGTGTRALNWGSECSLRSVMTWWRWLSPKLETLVGVWTSRCEDFRACTKWQSISDVANRKRQNIL